MGTGSREVPVHPFQVIVAAAEFADRCHYEYAAEQLRLVHDEVMPAFT